MANKSIQISSDTVKKTGLEVYRDISLDADLNQANILRSYKEIIPMAYIANDSYISFYKDSGNTTTIVEHLSDMFYSYQAYSAGSVIRKDKILIVRPSKMQPSTILTGSIDDVGISVNTAYKFNNSIQISAIDKDWWINNTTLIENPAIDLSGYPLNGYEYLQGELSSEYFIKTGFNIKAQISDTYYVEEYGVGPDSWMTNLKTENSSGGQPMRTEDAAAELLIFPNVGAVSSMAEYREYLQWNPYKLSRLVNVKAVFNSLHNIFTWTPGERILNPEFGSNLRKLLYEGITDFTAESIIAEIRRCIQEYDSRVNIVSINNASTVSDTENNTIQIDIVFTIPSLSREQFIYSYRYKKYSDE